MLVLWNSSRGVCLVGNYLWNPWCYFLSISFTFHNGKVNIGFTPTACLEMWLIPTFVRIPPWDTIETWWTFWRKSARTDLTVQFQFKLHIEFALQTNVWKPRNNLSFVVIKILYLCNVYTRFGRVPKVRNSNVQLNSPLFAPLIFLSSNSDTTSFVFVVLHSSIVRWYTWHLLWHSKDSFIQKTSRGKNSVKGFISLFKKYFYPKQQ